MFRKSYVHGNIEQANILVLFMRLTRIFEDLCACNVEYEYSQII